MQDVTGVARAAIAAGFTGAGLLRAIAIAGAESGFDPAATNDTCGYQWVEERGAYVHPDTDDELPAGTQPEYSIGAWQINLLAHPGVTEAEARDLESAARAAFRISRDGSDFDAWSTNVNLAPGLIELAAQTVQVINQEPATPVEIPEAIYLSQDQAMAALTFAAAALDGSDDVWIQTLPDSDVVTIAASIPRARYAAAWPALDHIGL